MKRVLFVDDEPNILDGLRRSLHGFRKEWEMVFALGGTRAIEEAQKAPVDVLVTDMRMPGMDGAELLRWFYTNHPETIRIVLSGHAESESIARAVPITHQFLNKPCDPEVLRSAVTRAFELQEMLGNPGVQCAVGGMSSLPSRPATYTALVEALARQDVELRDIAEIIESDSAMAMKILQLVNSAFFGIRQTINDVDQATRYLGINTIRDLVLSVEVFRIPSNCSVDLACFMDSLQKRSAWTGRVAKRMCADKKMGDLAFTSGILHDVGMLALATEYPDRYMAVLTERDEGASSLSEGETRAFGATHAVIGAYLLGAWGLPYPILEIAANHGQPGIPERPGFCALAAVHVASALVESSMADRRMPFSAARPIDMAYLDAVGVANRLPEWEAMIEIDVAAEGQPST